MPPAIDHDPDEPPRDRTGNWPYWANFAALLVLWLWMLTSQRPSWPSIALGVWTGLFVAIWGTAITGNRVPKWMR